MVAFALFSCWSGLLCCRSGLCSWWQLMLLLAFFGCNQLPGHLTACVLTFGFMGSELQLTSIAQGRWGVYLYCVGCFAGVVYSSAHYGWHARTVTVGVVDKWGCVSATSEVRLAVLTLAYRSVQVCSGYHNVERAHSLRGHYKQK